MSKKQAALLEPGDLVVLKGNVESVVKNQFDETYQNVFITFGSGKKVLRPSNHEMEFVDADLPSVS